MCAPSPTRRWLRPPPVAHARGVVSLAAAVLFAATGVVSAGPHAARRLAPGPLVLPLHSLHSHYALPMSFGAPTQPVDVAHVIIDTGSTSALLLLKAYDPLRPDTSATGPIVPPGNQLRLIDGSEVLFRDASTWEDVMAFQLDGPVQLPRKRETLVVAADLRFSDTPQNAGLARAEGFLGLEPVWFVTPGPSSPFLLLLNDSVAAVAAPDNLVFALDFAAAATLGGNGTGGELHLGVPSPVYEQSLLWSEAAPLPARSAYMFTMFHLSVCGVNLFANYTANWPAVVRTSSTCLTLPMEAFDHLTAWLPVSCDASRLAHAASQPICTIDLPSTATVDDAVLPWLRFHLSETSAAVFIRLADLLYVEGAGAEPGTVRYRLCLLRGRGFRGSMQILSPELGAVILGTMALRSLYVAFDVVATRIGFVNKAPWAQQGASGVPLDATAQCLPIPTCVGGEVLYAPQRACLPPPCDDYFFQTLDEGSRTCQFSPAFVVGAVFVVSLLVVLELTIATLRRRLSDDLTRPRAAASPVATPPRSSNRRGTLFGGRWGVRRRGNAPGSGNMLRRRPVADSAAVLT